MLLGAASWLSLLEVELPIGLGGVKSYQILMNSECYKICHAVRVWVLRSNSERERTQTYSYGPIGYAMLNSGGSVAETARMWAWKQPFI